MEYSKIVSVTGLPGLYELINTKQDGSIVRSLDDKTTKFASSRIHNFSHLESIEVYTVRENINLAEVFQIMEKAGNVLPDAKNSAAIKKYFETVCPDIDFERVYDSDLKKMIKWFETLKKNNVEIKLTESGKETETEESAGLVKVPEKKESPANVEKEKKSSKRKTGEKVEKESSSSKKAKPSKKTEKKKGK